MYHSLLRHFKSLGCVCLIVLVVTANSCISNKELTYFNNLNDTTFQLVSKNFEPHIQRGDIIYVGVTSADPTSAALFNSANTVMTPNAIGSFPTISIPGILVTDEGFIQLPKIGIIEVMGKTTNQIAKTIKPLLEPYLKDPIVTVRLMNFRISVLGEVAKPATINIPNERVTLLEALALAGDLTAYGNRKNLLLIRDSAGIQITKRIDITNSSAFNASTFYLRPNDVIYVEPNKVKSLASSNIPLITPYVFSALSILVILFQRIK
jgi:polysaccharide export outer membrane protein